MPHMNELNRNENDLAVSNKTKTLTEQFKQKLTENKSTEQLAQGKEEARIKELEDDAKPQWDAVLRKLDEIKYTVHRTYDSSWGRLVDLLMILNDALVKQGAIDRARFAAAIAPYSTSIFSAALSTVGGLAGGALGGVAGIFGVGQGVMAGAQIGAACITTGLSSVAGGLVGGAGSLLGLGGGVSAGAARGAALLLGTPNENVQYYVNMNESSELDFWLKRSDGKALTVEEKEGYMADVACWLGQQGYVPSQTPWKFTPQPGKPELNAERFAALRDNPHTGLNSYFNNLQKKYGLAAEFRQDDVEVIQTPTMSM